jgi:hypothetical protein
MSSQLKNMLFPLHNSAIERGLTEQPYTLQALKGENQICINRDIASVGSSL